MKMEGRSQIGSSILNGKKTKLTKVEYGRPQRYYEMIRVKEHEILVGSSQLTAGSTCG